MKSNTKNPRLKGLIKNLKEEEGIWKSLAEEIDTANRRRAEVNLYKLNKELEEGETALVPGKVLGYGDLDQKIKIGALNYSKGAKEKIEEAGSEPLTIQELKEQDPEKKNMRIIK